LFKIAQYYQVDMSELFDDSGAINISNNDIKGGNNIFASNPSNNTVNIQPSTEVVERILETQKQITLLLDSQIKLIAELLKK